MLRHVLTLGCCRRSNSFFSSSLMANTFRRSFANDFVAQDFTFPGKRRLDEVVKLPLLRVERKEILEEVWSTQHAETSNAVGAIFSDTDNNTIRHRARQCPTFIWPVRRDEGYFVMLSQWQENHCLFTFLDDYKKNPAMANPWLVVSLYDEFVAEHRLSLVRGSFSPPHLTRGECTRLVGLLHRFYVQDNFYRTVEDFTLRPKTFDATKHLTTCP
eukprot:g2832.t1